MPEKLLKMELDKKSDGGEYRVYSSRWGTLAAVASLTAVNNLVWISFASVNTQVFPENFLELI